MSAAKTFEVVEGAVHAIPLFAKGIKDTKRFYKKDFVDCPGDFAYMRIVSNEQGAGIIIEVFDRIGGLDVSVDEIVTSDRLFRPVATSTLPLEKQRWPLVGTCASYDKWNDSANGDIQLVLSPFDKPQLWTGGDKKPISLDEVAEYEPWTIHLASAIEKRIRSNHGRDS